MIPKVLHYCWLSDDPIPENLQRYIDGWSKKMPDYRIKKWDKSAFDIHSVKWVEDAYANRKWAFAADYIRAYALYTEGGFYLDSDVIALHDFDRYLDAGFVSSVEYDHAAKMLTKDCVDSEGRRRGTCPYVVGLGIQAAIIGAEKGHPFVKDVLNHYENSSFINPDGSFNQVIAPAIYSTFLENYGFKYKDEEQHLDERIVIYDSSVFAGYQTSRFSSAAVHMCAGSWVKTPQKKGVLARIKKTLFVRQMMNQLGISL